jgi:hypothetical protein
VSEAESLADSFHGFAPRLDVVGVLSFPAFSKR